MAATWYVPKAQTWCPWSPRRQLFHRQQQIHLEEDKHQDQRRHTLTPNWKMHAQPIHPVLTTNIKKDVENYSHLELKNYKNWKSKKLKRHNSTSSSSNSLDFSVQSYPF